MHRVGDLRYTYQGSRLIRSRHKLSRKCKRRLLRNSREHRTPPHRAVRRREQTLRRLRLAGYHLLEVEMTVHHPMVEASTEMSEQLMTVIGSIRKRYESICGINFRNSTKPGPRQEDLHHHQP